MNFWAEYYSAQGRAADLGPGPFTSKDIDFVGSGKVAERVAVRLGGRWKLPSLDDSTVSTGIVLYADDAGRTRQLDFVDQPYGLIARDVDRTAIPFEMLAADGKALGHFRVMHPVWCLMSRVHNTIGLHYDQAHQLAQLRAALICAQPVPAGAQAVKGPGDGAPS